MEWDYDNWNKEEQSDENCFLQSDARFEVVLVYEDGHETPLN